MERREQLTEAQRAALERELAELEGPKRAEIVQAIKAAREFGDLSENFEYHAAKNEQGLLERRIRILQERLRTAVLVGDAEAGRVSVGSVVEIEDEHGDRMRLEVSAVGGAGVVSPESPLGRALIGAREGEVVSVEAPRGSWRAKIVSIGAA
jgi:transcription elongation factor GreA